MKVKILILSLLCGLLIGCKSTKSVQHSYVEDTTNTVTDNINVVDSITQNTHTTENTQTNTDMWYERYTFEPLDLDSSLPKPPTYIRTYERGGTIIESTTSKEVVESQEHIIKLQQTIIDILTRKSEVSVDENETTDSRVVQGKDWTYVILTITGVLVVLGFILYNKFK